MLDHVPLSPDVLIFYAIIFNAIILAVLLLSVKRNRKAARWLGILIFAFAFNLLGQKIFTYLYLKYPSYTLLNLPTVLAIGPLIWFYCRSLLGYPIERKRLWYFLPFVMDLLYHLSKSLYVYLYDLPNKGLYFSPTLSTPVQVEFLIHDGFAIIFNAYFLLKSWRFVQGKMQTLKEDNSSGKLWFSLRWLNLLLILFNVTMAIWIAYHLVEIFIFPRNIYIAYYLPLHILLAFVTLFMGYRALMQPEITEVVKSVIKYQSSQIDPQELEEMKEKLIASIEGEKLYMQPELNMQSLSSITAIPPHKISQILSKGLRSNFYELINSYRIEEVKRYLKDSKLDNRTILSLAYDAGFNSKNAFYKAFKEATGMSPSEFRKSS
ncbi:MAG: helix-turn-helix domain-containing protein [Bacteroidota bacterium]